ncbi:hypothetical protein Sjap_025331 [Stephania japonica]|uniref:Uncharacterized protein n=1 Tax=Stephania japonica TaxID=461633 RepID=A0AAP0E446_9MAGN
MDRAYIYGEYLMCIGNITGHQFKTCVDSVISNAAQLCGPICNGSVVWSEHCMLRYADDTSSLLIIHPVPNAYTNNYLSHYCTSSSGNLTTSNTTGTYATNLNQLLSSLPSNVTTTNNNWWYQNISFGQYPDKVYGAFMCRADVTPQFCKTCVDSAITKLTQLCVNHSDGYMAPEYAMHGCFSVRSEVYGFSVLLLEILTGLKNNFVDQSEEGGNLLTYAWRHWKEGTASQLINPNITDRESSMSEAVRCIQIALLCVQDEPADRPSMRSQLRPTILEVVVDLLLARSNAARQTYTHRKKLDDEARSVASVAAFLMLIKRRRATTAPSAPSQTTSPNAPSQTAAPSVPSQTTSPYAPSQTAAPSAPSQTTAPSASANTAAPVNTKFFIHISIYCLAYIDQGTTVESLKLNFSTVKAATNDFAAANEIGKGGFGLVYKGQLPNGQEVVVKRHSMRSSQGKEEFDNEIVLAAKFQHRNLVKLIGFAEEGEEKLLIFEFMPNASLDRFIYDPDKHGVLDWETRLKIIKGIAEGLLHLHESSRDSAIHRI